MTPGSQPLRNKRHEQFAQLLATGEAASASEAYATVYGKAHPAPGEWYATAVRVGGSNLRSKCADRIAYIRVETAKADAEGAEPVTAQSIGAILESITEDLSKAAATARAAGHTTLAQKISKELVVHVGRADRARRAGAEVIREDDAESHRRLERFLSACAFWRMCSCQT